MANLFQPSETNRTQTENVGTIVTEEEPKEATNAGLSWALVLTVVLSVLTFFGGLLALSIAPYSDQKATLPQTRYFDQSAGSRTQQPQGDASFSGGQAVQSDAVLNNLGGVGNTDKPSGH